MAGCAAFPVTDVVFNRLHFVVLQHMRVGSACSLMPPPDGACQQSDPF